MRLARMRTYIQRLQENGTWKGMLGYVANGTVDTICLDYTDTPIRRQYFDFSTTVFEVALHFRISTNSMFHSVHRSVCRWPAKRTRSQRSPRFVRSVSGHNMALHAGLHDCGPNSRRCYCESRSFYAGATDCLLYGSTF